MQLMQQFNNSLRGLSALGPNDIPMDIANDKEVIACTCVQYINQNLKRVYDPAKTIYFFDLPEKTIKRYCKELLDETYQPLIEKQFLHAGWQRAYFRNRLVWYGPWFFRRTKRLHSFTLHKNFDFLDD